MEPKTKLVVNVLYNESNCSYSIHVCQYLCVNPVREEEKNYHQTSKCTRCVWYAAILVCIDQKQTQNQGTTP